MDNVVGDLEASSMKHHEKDDGLESATLNEASLWTRIKEKYTRTSWLIIYLNWCFRVSFTSFLVSSLAIFISHTIIFAGLIVWAGSVECIDAFEEEFTLAETYAAAWTLSWTTFTTVGYGQIYPNIDAQCPGINFVCMFNAYVGVLFSGFCGAILFGKVSVIYSKAGVIFSSGCVLRYGEGVDDNDDDDDYDESGGHDGSEHEPETAFSILPTSPRAKYSPFPYISFRVVNEYSNTAKGSIMNLSLNVVAAIEKRELVKVDINSNEKQFVPRRRFREVIVDPSSVSHYERVLYVRHELNSKSPLLTAEARKAIKRNSDHWPLQFNNPEKLKSIIEFAQIYVSLEGVSDDSKSSVYAKMTYEKDDIKIGYKFMDMTYRASAGSKLEYMVDFNRVNMIIPQAATDREVKNSCMRIKPKNKVT